MFILYSFVCRSLCMRILAFSVCVLFLFESVKFLCLCLFMFDLFGVIDCVWRVCA